MYQKKYKQSRLYKMWKAEYYLAKKHCFSLLYDVPTFNAFSTNSKKESWVFCDISGGYTFYDTLDDLKNDAVIDDVYYKEKFDERMNVYKEILNRKEESDSENLSENPSSENPYPQMLRTYAEESSDEEDTSTEPVPPLEPIRESSDKEESSSDSDLDWLYEGVDDYRPSSIPLNAALEVKDEKKANALLNSGDNPHKRDDGTDNNGYNALHIAAQEGCGLDLFSKILSKFKSKVNAVCCPYIKSGWYTNGYTALMLAVVNNHLDMVVALMQHPFINLNVQNEDKETALYLAVQTNQPIIVAQLLLSNDIDTSLKDITGTTPLDLAIDWGYEKCASLLRGRSDEEESNVPVTFASGLEAVAYILSRSEEEDTSTEPVPPLRTVRQHQQLDSTFQRGQEGLRLVFEGLRFNNLTYQNRYRDFDAMRYINALAGDDANLALAALEFWQRGQEGPALNAQDSNF